MRALDGGESGPAVEEGRTRRLFPWTAAASAVVLVLALSAILAPPPGSHRPGGLLLVIDPVASLRETDLGAPLAGWLGPALRRTLRAQVVPSLAEVPAGTWADVGLVICPDRVALALPDSAFVTLAAGRRHAPLNLRPRSVLVYRRSAGPLAEPWRTAPQRTILGDTLTLTGCGPACREGRCPWRTGRGRAPALGSDPYDHAAVLEALRLGCFDYAVVREWDAQRFFAAGLLDSRAWGMEMLSVPVPDVVVLVSRAWPGSARVRAGEVLLGLGRHQESGGLAGEGAALRALAEIDLAGFNLLLEPDFEFVRREFAACWPGGAP